MAESTGVKLVMCRNDLWTNWYCGRNVSKATWDEIMLSFSFAHLTGSVK